MIGSVLGKYRIEAELSRGGMGAVYRARHEIIDRPVAVKLLRPELTEDPELVARFVNEARAASAIQHPSIIDILDFGYTDDGQAYLVMEFLDGESLAQRLARKKRLAPREATQIIRSVAAALSAAHAKGIFHRDLKPDNVFLVPDPDLGERAKVLDFGVAKLVDRATSSQRTQTGVLMGTPLYMAPEQARSAHAIDHRADLYSLGCILYELVVGMPPFSGSGAGELITLHMFEEPVPPSHRAQGISPELEAVILRLLAKEPAARYASAADVIAALGTTDGRAAQVTAPPPDAGQPRVAVASPSLAPSARGVSRAARNRLPIVAACLTAVAVAIAVVVVLVARAGDDRAVAPRTELPPPVTAPAPTPVVPAPTPVVPAPAPVVPVTLPTPVTEDTAQVPAPVPAPTPRPAPRDRRRPLPVTDKGSPIEHGLD